MITVICGKTGSGKSLYAMWLMNELSQAGKRVCTNMELTPKHPSYSKIVRIGTDEYPVLDEDRAFFSYFKRDKHGHTYMNFFIDEADVDLDCTDSVGLTKQLPQIRSYFKQHRKRRDNIWLIVQNPNWLYNRIRDIAHEFVWCTMDGDTSWNGNPLLKYVIPRAFWQYRRQSFSELDMRPDSFLRSGSITFREGEKLYDWYRTEQIIGSADF
jgi:hypothetical protein